MKNIGALVLATVAACDAGGAYSPQDVFEAAKSAGRARDYKGVFECIDPEGRDPVLMAMSIGAAFAGNDSRAELDALQKKHGVKESRTAISDRSDMRAAARESFAAVADKAALFADLAVLIETYSKDRQNPFADMCTLTDVAITGDTAKGKEVRDGKEKEIAFVKRENRWYLAME